MSTTRDIAMIFVGAAIGSLSTWAIGGAVSSGPAERTAAPGSRPASAAPALEPPPSGAAPVAPQALHPVEERLRREVAEARVQQLEQELAVSRTAVSAGGSAVHASSKLDPAAVTARIKAIEGEIDRCFEAKDGKRLLALYVELAQYGREAWPVAAKIGALFGSLEEEDGAKELGLAQMDFFKAFVTADYTALYADAIGHPDSYDKKFRAMAIWGLMMAGDASAGPVLLDGLKTEKDPQNLQAIASALAQNPPPGAADQIGQAIATTKNATARQTLVWTLTQIPGDEATRAVAALVAAETDPNAKAQLELNLKARTAPVAGYYLGTVTEGSEAATAGLKPGDVVTARDGKPIKTWQDLQAGDDDATATRLTVYRDGATFDVTLKGGKSMWEHGFYGDFARGPAR